MDDTRERLMNCFQVVFPDLSTEAVQTASSATLESWDSVAAITLMNVVEEEFGLSMDLDNLAELDSFEHLYSHLQKRLQAV
ncbi:MAG TPA: acyl carrier protein [Candidatus Binatia bacterium]|nr:acyl carrier protein [Candidatus Binatia bacterium]